MDFAKIAEKYIQKDDKILDTPNLTKPKSREYILTDTQINTILSNIKDPKEVILVYGMLYTGMRVSEFLHLTRSWINFNDELISIPKEMKCSCTECSRLRGGVWKIKTKDGVRDIYIVDEIKGLLKSYFSKYTSVLELIPNRIIAWKIITGVGKRNGIKLFPHSLRSSFATILASKGFSEYGICGVMGWSDIMRAKFYVKIAGKRVKDEFKKKWKERGEDKDV